MVQQKETKVRRLTWRRSRQLDRQAVGKAGRKEFTGTQAEGKSRQALALFYLLLPVPRSRLVVEVLEGVPPSTELRVLFERPVKVRVSAVLAGLTLQSHQLGMHGLQDIDCTLIHVPLRVRVRLLS